MVGESRVCGEMRKGLVICGRSGQIKVAVARRVSSSRLMCQNWIRVIKRNELYTGLVAKGGTKLQLLIVTDVSIICNLEDSAGTVFFRQDFIS